MNAPTGHRSQQIKTLALCASVFVLAFAVRAWTNTWLTDFWGDSYHHWLITRLTMLEGGVYSDYKGLQVVWSPFYHYLSILPLVLAGRGDMVPLQWMNTFWGACACALCAFLAWRLYANRIAAFTAGALLAFMTWHIAFSGMNVAEVFSGVLILSILVLVTGVSAQPDASGETKKLVPPPGELLRLAAIFLLAFLMPLTRTDLSVYLAILTLWLWIQKRYLEALLVMTAVSIALLGWSGWSYLNTGNFFHWYQQYTQNNLHDWLRLNESTPNAALTFAEYMNRLSPYVLPALLAGHSLFLIVGYARSIVPLLTERYLALDLPLVALLMGGWVWLIANWAGNLCRHNSNLIPAQPNAKSRVSQSAAVLVAVLVLATTWLRFQNDIPELEIRRWGIDPEWQIGGFLGARVQPGDVVLTDAPVAIYRSGKHISAFVSSVELDKVGDPAAALRQHNVRWIVTQPLSYDAASNYIPRALLQAQADGTVDGITYEIAWRYDPSNPDIQSQVWHVIQAKEP